jgi:hypothetical protein
MSRLGVFLQTKKMAAAAAGATLPAISVEPDVKSNVRWCAKLGAAAAELKAKKAEADAILATGVIARLNALLTKMEKDRDPQLMTGKILLRANDWPIGDYESAIRTWAGQNGLGFGLKDVNDECE